MNNKSFYDREFSGDNYASFDKAQNHPHHDPLRRFIDEYSLQDKKCLEIGCGRGSFQNMVKDYSGFDISSAVAKFIHKPFVSGDATKLPFNDNSFDAIWTINVLEHIPHPERAISEMRRVLKPGGMLYLAAAWHCRTWAADGYPVRPYSDFPFKGKLIKFSILFRNAAFYLAFKYLLLRIAIMLRTCLFQNKKRTFHYKKITPNFEHFWMSDSDAVNNMDQLNAIYWFTSRGDSCLNANTFFKKLTIMTGELIFRINKSAP